MVFRTIKAENPFIQIDKTSVYDSDLSWKAKGLLLYLLSRPENWDFYLSEVIKHATDGKSSVSAGIRELEEAGYLVRERLREEDGKYGSMLYLVYEKPQNMAPASESTYTRKSHVGKSHVGKPNVRKSDTSNKDLTNKDCSNKDNITSSLPEDGTVKKLKDRLKDIWNNNCGQLYKIRTIGGSRAKLVNKAIKDFPEEIEDRLRVATSYVATNGFYEENGYGFDNCIRNLDANYQKGLAAGSGEEETEEYKQFRERVKRWATPRSQ